MKLNAMEGCKAFDLPTEAQWEYACRAGTDTRYHSGDAEEVLEQIGWYRENAGEQTHPVGLKEPNPYGQYDMHGNVFEWCQDWFGSYPEENAIDPSGPLSGSCRVVRGGSWIDSARRCQASYRTGVMPANHGNVVGVRLVMYPGSGAVCY